MASKRGLLIVLEGNDRVGKTTQALKIVQWFKGQQKQAEMIRFPDRNTPIGKLIDGYCKKDIKMNDHVIHLLFTANRWERFEEMQEKINAGINLVVDRYSYSGVAYSAAKDGMKFDWCFAPESGLLRPDCILFLSSDIETLEKRGDFGDEVYENCDFQTKVRQTYARMRDSSWNVSFSLEFFYKLLILIIFVYIKRLWTPEIEALNKSMKILSRLLSLNLKQFLKTLKNFDKKNI